MSVFNKPQGIKPTGSDKWIPCNQYHRINDVAPTVNGNIHSIQNPQYIGKVCDCKKQLYAAEGTCGCPGGNNHWEIKWLPNPNY